MGSATLAYCTTCGHQISTQAVMCPNCGQPGSGSATRQADGAVISLVCGVLSFLIPFVGPATAPIAIIFGRRARLDAATNPGVSGAGFGTAGLVLGIVWLVVAAIIFFFVFSVAQVARR